MKKMLNFKNLWRLILVLLVLLIIVRLFKSVNSVNKGFEEYNEPTSKLTTSDSAQFNRDLLTRIRVVNILNTKVRNSTLILTVDGRWPLVVARIPTFDTLTMRNIHVSEVTSGMTTGISYHMIENFRAFKMGYSSGMPVAAPSIWLNVSGDSVMKKIENDSVVSISAKARNCSVRYGENSPNAFWLGAKESFGILPSKLPIQLFLRKEKSQIILYLLTSNSFEHSIPDSLVALFKN